MNQVIALALGANISFALGAQVFTYYSRTISSVWMNAFKALVAGLAFFVVSSLFYEWQNVTFIAFNWLLLSGALGLGLGDALLLYSFSRLGPGRTLMIFGFQPLIVGALAYGLFGQVLEGERLYAIIFFILCVLSFGLESYKATKTWNLVGLSCALAGMALDGVGVVMSRYVFDEYPAIHPFQVNAIRCLGAVFVLLFFSAARPRQLIGSFLKQNGKNRMILILGPMVGTFLSLACYVTALRSAHLASLSGIAITGTLFSTLFEHVWKRSLPGRWFIPGVIFFSIGIFILIF